MDIPLQKLCAFGRRHPPRAAQREVPPLSANRQQLLWAILENLSEGVVACDAAGTLAFFNRATRELHGISEESTPSDRWSEHYSLQRADGTPMAPGDVPLQRALHGETVRDAVMVIAPRDQDARTVICTGGPLYDSDGALLGAVVAMRETKDHLPATGAHEPRNPPTPILGRTYLLQRHIEEEKARTALAAI